MNLADPRDTCGGLQTLETVRHWCDDAVCLLAPKYFWAIGQFYEDFKQVEDEEVLEILRTFAHAAAPNLAIGKRG